MNLGYKLLVFQVCQLPWVILILNKFYFILRRFEAKRSNRRVLPEISRDKTAVIAPTTVRSQAKWCQSALGGSTKKSELIS